MDRRRETEIDRVFQKIPFLVGLSEAERIELRKHIVHRVFRRNETILHEADTSNTFYLILSGQVKVINISAEGKERIMAIHKEGDFFGEMAILDGKTTSAAVVALKDGRICLINKESFDRIVMANRWAVDAIIDLLCMRLRQAWLQIRVMSFADAEHRIRAVLQELGEKFGVRDSRGLIIGLGITHQSIASLSTTSRETVTRFLNKAAKSGEIELLADKKILLMGPFFKKTS
ncbi:MAG: Crp/Fnr family transcriptional regulator [Deltaproteobacteria bacterium]|nr:Crp/Fnr family transcriptional regulator [Deltaproteobacteria bacterium]